MRPWGASEWAWDRVSQRVVWEQGSRESNPAGEEDTDKERGESEEEGKGARRGRRARPVLEHRDRLIRRGG
eukprot:2010050-Alexandrium_andersonii.AAC.1